MKPCNITSWPLITAWFSESYKTTAPIESVQYLISTCTFIVSQFLAVAYVLLYKPQKKIKGNECIHATTMLKPYCGIQVSHFQQNSRTCNSWVSFLIMSNYSFFVVQSIKKSRINISTKHTGNRHEWLQLYGYLIYIYLFNQYLSPLLNEL